MKIQTSITEEQVSPSECFEAVCGKRLVMILISPIKGSVQNARKRYRCSLNRLLLNKVEQKKRQLGRGQDYFLGYNLYFHGS